jgi:hypothetical protein
MPALLLVIAFVMPPETSVSLGSLRLSPYRVILLIMVVPSLFHLLSGKAGPSTASTLPSLPMHVVRHRTRRIWRPQALESGGIYFVESFGAYAMGRRYIRNVAGTSRRCRMLRRTRRVRPCSPWRCRSRSPMHFLREAFRSVLGGPGLPIIDPRMGLARAFGSFEHPILFGVFCSMAFATAWFVARRKLSPLRGWLLIGCIVIASFVSLSAGAWLMLGLQIALAVMGPHHEGPAGPLGILDVAFVAVLVVVSLLSNRSPVKVFISYASFSLQSSYNRILIWEYGTAEVARIRCLASGSANGCALPG